MRGFVGAGAVVEVEIDAACFGVAGRAGTLAIWTGAIIDCAIKSDDFFRFFFFDIALLPLYCFEDSIVMVGVKFLIKAAIDAFKLEPLVIS